MTATSVHPSLLARESHVAAGWLSRRLHPDNPRVAIYNYTHQATGAAQWDDVTVHSRGACFHLDTGVRIARPFSKFFNLGERDETRPEALPLSQPYACYEKVDGWLGVGYEAAAHGLSADPASGWAVASRGSFDSEGARWATSVLSRYKAAALPKGATPCFEIVSPLTRILVDYNGREALVLLAIFDIETGREWPMADVDAVARETGFDRPAVYAYSLEDALLRAETETHQCEGWVLLWPHNGLRVKVKTAAYKLVAKAAQAMGPLWAWEAVLAGDASSVVNALPDVLRVEGVGLVAEVERRLRAMELDVEKADAEVGGAGMVDLTDATAVKAMALSIQQHVGDSAVRAALFARMRRRGPAAERESLLKPIRPTGNVWRDPVA